MTRLVAGALGLWLAACQAAYDRQDEVIRREFPHVRVNKIGDFHPAHGGYEDVAVLNALRAAAAAGVSAEALREATVAPVTRIGVAPVPGTLGYPAYYDVWISVQGCPSSLFVRARSTGRLSAFHDPAGCLGEAKP